MAAHKTGRARSKYRDSRLGESPETGSVDETEDGPQYHDPYQPTHRVDSPVRAKNKWTNHHRTWGRLDVRSRQPRGSGSSCPPPLSTGHSPPPSGLSTVGRAHGQGFLDLTAHSGPLDLAYEVARAQRAPNDANQMILRRKARRRRFDEDIEHAKTAAREGFLVVERAEQVLAQSVAPAAAGATAAPSPSTHPQGVASQRPRRGDSALFQGQRRVHSVCTEGSVLPSIGDRDGGNGLRPSHIREASVVASGRPFHGSGLDSHGLYALCRADESHLNTCPLQSSADGPRQGLRPRLVG